MRPVWYDMTIIWERLQCKAATVTSYPNRDPFSSAILDIPEVSHAILSLSTRLRPIAKKLLRDHTIKQFHTEEELRAILGSCPTTYINPKRVQLAFTMDGFMDFFRRCIARHRPLGPTSPATRPMPAGVERPPVPRTIS